MKKTNFDHHLRIQELKDKLETKKEKRKLWKIILIILGILIVIFGVGLSYKVVSIGQSIVQDDRSTWDFVKGFLGGGAKSLFNIEEKLKGEGEGRINILLLGVGGPGHEGPNLTDTMMIASIKPDTHEVALLSIPRDLYVNIPGIGYSKINAAHAYGEEYSERLATTGVKLAQEVISNVTGLPIHYYVRMDFKGFEKIIDALGGVDIDVPCNFYDYLHHNMFYKGVEHMDGERALWYVRVRYVEGSEGGDFARARRQQQVLLEIKKKVLSIYTILDIPKINELFDIVGDHLRTNFEVWEMKRFYDMSKEVDPNKVTTKVLDTETDGLLIPDTVILGGMKAYVLKPKAGDFSEIQNLAQNIFDLDKIKQENASIEIQNGTKISGLAYDAKLTLEKLDYNVIRIANAQRQDYEKTVIYDFSGGNKSYTIKALKDKFEANVSQVPLSEEDREDRADIVVILGQDYVNY